MEFYLSWQNNQETILLPINPSSFEMSNPSQNSTININNIGEVNLIGKKGLSSISIESFFPKQRYTFCNTDPLPPYDYISIIKKWKDSGKPVRLVITLTDINIAVAIENFTYKEQNGTGNVYYTLDLKEYRFIGTREDKIVKTSNGTTLEVLASNREAKTIPTEYIVKSGDTLWSIAKKSTGNGANYKAIAKTNNIKDPNKIYPGQKLVI